MYNNDVTQYYDSQNVARMSVNVYNNVAITYG